MKTSMAQLGRDATDAVQTVKDSGYGVLRHYVNKTQKYVSIKLVVKHLTDEQIDKVAEILHNKHPDRFLVVYNNTAHPASRGMSWTEDKVNVRFTQ